MTQVEKFLLVKKFQLFIRACFQNFKQIRIDECQEIDNYVKDTGDKRYFAHVGHIPNIICISMSILDLPEENIIGILLHEIGHLGTKDLKPMNIQESEDNANDFVYENFDIKIAYKTDLAIQTAPKWFVDIIKKFEL